MYFSKHSQQIKNSLVYLPESFTLKEAFHYIQSLKLKAGNIVCDPFAGAGILGVAATLKGFQSINIEIDQKTFKKMERNFQVLHKFQTLTKVQAELINADSEIIILNRKIDAVITSPPFSLSTQDENINPQTYEKHINKITRIFINLQKYLNPNSSVLIEFGDDIFKGKTISLIKALIENMQKIGYKLLKYKPINISLFEYKNRNLSTMLFVSPFCPLSK